MYTIVLQKSVSDFSLFCSLLRCQLYHFSSFASFGKCSFLPQNPCSCPIYCFMVLRERAKPQQLSQCASNYMARNWWRAEFSSSTHPMKGKARSIEVLTSEKNCLPLRVLLLLIPWAITNIIVRGCVCFCITSYYCIFRAHCVLNWTTENVTISNMIAVITSSYSLLHNFSKGE